MKKTNSIALAVCFVVICVWARTTPINAQDQAVDAVYRIPQLGGVMVDGSSEDWSDRGFCISVLADVEGRVREPTDFDPTLRLGWDEEGLLILAEVRDDGAAESDIDRRLFLGDSLEFFIGTARDEHDYLMLLVAPGTDPNHPASRHVFFDERDGGPVAAGALPVPEAELEVRPVEGGYILEARVLWSNLDLVPQAGMTLAFQAYAMDLDPNGELFRVAWYPAFDTHQNQTTSMMTLELAESAATPVEAVVRGRYRDILVVADAAHEGANLRVEQRGETLAETALASKSGRATGSLRLPPPLPGHALGRLDVFLNDQLIQAVDRGSAAAMMGTALAEGGLAFYQNVFSGRDFPPVEFEHPRLVEDLIGPYQLITRFYDPDFNPVETADQPGRYGAIVTVQPTRTATPSRSDSGVEVSSETDSHFSASGGGGTRFFTLYCTDDDHTVPTRHVPPWVLPNLDEVTLLGGLTLTPQTTAESATLDEAEAIRRAAAIDRHEVSVDAGQLRLDPADLADRAWWVRCKRVYYGFDGPPEPLPLPRPLPGSGHAQELREGSPEEAGLDPSVIEKIEAVCDHWTAKNKGQGFTICAARNGVAFFHRAYGEHQGQPMTTQTPGWVQSVAKVVTGAVFMMYMDRGLVDLDAPIQTYLPRLGEVEVRTPFTIRQLLTHTSGLRGNYGDEYRDLEERIADEYAQLKIPVTYLYGGTGFALATKAIEALSSQTFPVICEQLLFDPLGLKHTTVIDSHSRVYTTAWDLAKLGQLMLNGGAYGSQNFFSPETLELAKPQPLVKIFGPQTEQAWGIGFWGSHNAEHRMLSGTAFGHNSGNSSFFRVDPATGLVLTASSLEDKRYLSDAIRKEIIEVIEAAIREDPHVVK